MRCKICGAKLKKDGDICTNCYKTYLEEEELKKDTNEIFKIKRKYSIAYEFAKYFWIIIIFILSFLVCLSGGVVSELALILIFFVVVGLLLFLDKRIAMGTTVVFYEKKMVYTFKFLFINIVKTVKYTDFKEVKVYQTFNQKRFGYGDLCIYANGTFPGATLLNGFQIKNIENVKEVSETVLQMMETIKK